MSLVVTAGKVYNPKWVNGRARARNHAKFRRHLCRILGLSFDCCCTTGELHSEARVVQSRTREVRT